MIFTLINKFDKWVDKYQDQKVVNYPFMSSCQYVLWPTIIYILLVKIIGPKLMENRKPFQLRTTLILYNLFLVLLSAYIFIEGGFATYFGSYSFQCEPMDTSNSPQANRVVYICWIYFVSKYIELLDTVFFVMRKKFNQVSFLHVFHHSAMLMFIWYGLKTYPTGHGVFLGWINSLVHIVMYFYYMLSAVGPHMQKYLQWKRYLTVMQLVQFALVFYHSAQVLFNGCDYSWSPIMLIMVHAAFFAYLFGNFYYSTYIKKKTN